MIIADARPAMKRKQESYCIMCGGSSHCGERLTRKEIEVINDKIIKEDILESCNNCKCQEFSKDED